MAEEYGKVKKSTMTAIADAIRAKKDTTAIFTPAQMAVEIESLEMVSELPNAEDRSFGAHNSVYENGITSWAGDKKPQSISNSHGYEFTPNEDLAVAGFRAYLNNQTSVLKLWEQSSGNVIATITAISTTSAAWVDFMLDTPVNIFAGKKYAVTRETSPVWKTYTSQITVNPKITFNQACKGSGSYPSSKDTTIYPLGMVDIIITEPITESVITEYKIQTTTMNSIAAEVQRITNTASTLTTAQIQAGLESVVLQEKTITPTTEQQIIVPDSDYYGFSKVTVEAVEDSDDGSAAPMFASSARGRIPEYKNCTASSILSLDNFIFESYAMGTLSE